MCAQRQIQSQNDKNERSAFATLYALGLQGETLRAIRIHGTRLIDPYASEYEFHTSEWSTGSVKRLLIAASACVALSQTIDASAGDWTGWRGPHADGISPEASAATHWSNAINVLWRVETPGVGHSSPIVCGENVYLTACELETEQRLLLCYDRQSGEQRWRRVIATSPIEEMHRENTPASSTPVTDGKRVYVSFFANGDFLVAAVSPDGEPVWTKRLGEFVSRHGFHSCPIMHDGSLLVAGLQDSDDAFLAKLNAETGATLWHTITETPIRSFSPPHVSKSSGRAEVVLSGANCTSSYNYVSGELLWRVNGPAEKTVSSIVEGNGRLFVAGGRDNQLLAIDRDKQGEPEIAWVTSKGVPYVSSPILFGQVLHVLSDEGVYTQLDAESGDVIERKRLLRATSASPVIVDSRMYISDESGKTAVVTLDRTTGRRDSSVPIQYNEIDEPVFATLAVSNGDLFLRGTTHLYCIRESAHLAER